MIEQKKMDAELLPCPHCNGGAEMRLYDGDYFVQCVECFASTAADYQTEQSAAEKWNRRSLPVGVPDGYALVPVEPTPQMLRAGVAQALGAYPIYRAMLAAAPTVKAEQVQAMPQEWWQIIHDTLRDYRMSTLGDGEGGGYPLIDAMTADGQSVAGGIEECTYLADAIWNALPTQAPSLPAADQQYPDGIADDLERSDWTPIEALQWYAAGKHFDVVDGRTRIIDTGAVASNALKHASLEYLELKGDAELSELRAALSAQQSDPWAPSGADYDRAIHRNPDAKAWADFFIATFPGQADKHDLMLGWFANAMMAMHDHLKAQQSAHVSVPRELLERVATHLEWDGDESQTVIQYANKCDALAAELRALLNGGEA